MRSRLFVPLAALLLASSGCYRITLVSGRAPAPAPQAFHDDAWHHDFVFGLAEGSGPIDLETACPNGWAKLHTEQTFVKGLVGVLTGGLYTPQSETLTCAEQPRFSPPEQKPPAPPPAPKSPSAPPRS